jgi:ubiquinone/menaquinone biosynthesis C-methylase UbiE
LRSPFERPAAARLKPVQHPAAGVRSAAGGGFGAEEMRIREVYRRRLPNDEQKYSLMAPANLYFAHAMDRALVSLLIRHRQADLKSARILDVGCGNGAWLRRFMLFGAQGENLTGVDLMPEAIAQARLLCPAQVRLICGSATSLQFPDGEFDIVCQSMVLSSVLDEPTRSRIAAEMIRVASPSGLIVSFDFLVKSPRNPDTLAIGRGELRRLFPGCEIDFRRVMLAPPLARLLAPLSLLMTNALECVPWLRSHYLAAMVKRAWSDWEQAAVLN